MVELRICEKKPLLLSQKCVVYQFKCDQCDAGNVGYTTQHLHQRIEVHKMSVVGKHVKEIHGQSMDNLNEQSSVLRKCMNKLDCLVYEMLLIKQYKPNLNRQSDSIRSK